MIIIQARETQEHALDTWVQDLHTARPLVITRVLP
jgi:hypothetical protein